MATTSQGSPVLKIVDSMLTEFYKDKPSSEYRKSMHKATLPIFHKNFQPHISGYQFAYMVSGSWFGDALQYLGNEELGFPIAPQSSVESINKNIATFIKGVEYTSPLLEYDSVSGRAKNIMNPSKENIATDFTVSIHDNIQNDYLVYHTLWYNYIKQAKLGNITIPDSPIIGDFYDVSYQNKYYVFTFDAKMTIKSIVVILGVMPTDVPISEYSGKYTTTTSEHSTFRFKCIDIIPQLIYDESSLGNSLIFKDFKHDYEHSMSQHH